MSARNRAITLGHTDIVFGHRLRSHRTYRHADTPHGYTASTYGDPGSANIDGTTV